MAGQTITGKAFEYACLIAFKSKIDECSSSEVIIEESDQLHTARDAYEGLSETVKLNYDLAAKTAVKLIFPLEPKLENGDDTIMLTLLSDANGVNGDVRDLVCIRISEEWEIGISCKHNHEALKHPRITQSCDFGSDWVGYKCSDDFINKMHTVLNPLDGSKLWREIDNKFDNFYIPILKNYMSEITLLCKEHEDVPAKLLEYFFGTNDFYKVISQEKERQTKVMGFNLNGTMNKASGEIKPIYKVKKLHMPTRLIETRLKNEKQASIILTFDGGWEITMRIHNKDKEAKITSLAWDVKLTGMPPDIYQQQRSWDE